MNTPTLFSCRDHVRAPYPFTTCERRIPAQWTGEVVWVRDNGVGVTIYGVLWDMDGSVSPCRAEELEYHDVG